MLKMLLAILSSLIFFTSCDVAPKLSSISLIATSFDTGSSNFPGGVIIVGQRTDEPGKVSYSFAGSSNLSINIERGDWTFYGIGYAGPSKFTGATSCATATTSFRGGASATVSLELSAEGCSGKLSRTLLFRTIHPQSCSALYNYNSDDDIFEAIDPNDPGTWCPVPDDQNQNTSFYKLAALDIVNETKTGGVSTNCINNSAQTFYLPSEVVPFKVSYYRSLEECNSTLSPHVSYNFVNGLKTGDPALFNHFYKETSATASELLLPGAITRSFKSPFMNMIPRITCEVSAPCNIEPALPVSFNVPWDEESQSRLIARNTSLSTCSESNFSSKYFTISDCYVKNRHMYANVQRNSLQCQASSAFGGGTVVDIYERNNRIYILYRLSGKTRIKVTDYDSIPKYDFEVTADTTPLNMAASDSGEVFVLTPTVVRRFTPSGNTYNFVRDYVSINFNHIEVSNDAKFAFLANDASDRLYAYSTETALQVSFVNYTDTIKQLQYVDGILYRMTYDGTTGSLIKTIVNPVTGVLSLYPNMLLGPWNESGLIARTLAMNNFYIANQKLYLLNPNNHGLYTYVIDENTGEWTILHGGGGAQLAETDATVMIATSEHFYFSNGTYLRSYNQLLPGGAWTDIGDYDGTCSENVIVTKGTTTETLSLKTVLTPDLPETNPRLFATATKLIGRPTFTYPNSYYFFPHLNEGQQRPTNGGKLSVAQYLLGPAGIGGMLNEYSSCTEIKNLLDISPVIQKSYLVDDPYKGARNYQISMSKMQGIIPPFICDDSTPWLACANLYDIQINVNSTGVAHKEKYTLKLKCESKVGELDYLDYNSSDSHKELIYWNTNSALQGRVDSYKSVKTATNFTAEIALINKISSGHVRAREITINKDSERIRAGAVDYERDTFSHRMNFSEIDEATADYLTSLDYSAYASDTSFGGVATLCNDEASALLNFTSVGCASISAQSAVNSKNMSLSIDALDDADDPDSDFQNFFLMRP